MVLYYVKYLPYVIQSSFLFRFVFEEHITFMLHWRESWKQNNLPKT